MYPACWRSQRSSQAAQSTAGRRSAIRYGQPDPDDNPFVEPARGALAELAESPGPKCAVAPDGADHGERRPVRVALARSRTWPWLRPAPALARERSGILLRVPRPVVLLERLGCRQAFTAKDAAVGRFPAGRCLGRLIGRMVLEEVVGQLVVREADTADRALHCHVKGKPSGYFGFALRVPEAPGRSSGAVGRAAAKRTGGGYGLFLAA